MSDGAFSFTIATVAEPGLAATKRIVRLSDGRLEKSDYDRVALWRFQPMAAASVAVMAEVLHDLAGRADRMILMGRPRPGLRSIVRSFAAGRLPIQARTRSKPSTASGCRSTSTTWRSRRRSAAAIALTMPHDTRATQCFRQSFTASRPRRRQHPRAGSRAHTGAAAAVLCARPGAIAGRSAAWARGARAAGLPVDPAVIQAGQPIYTARPLFQGIADPVPPRLRAFVLKAPAVIA